jgi:23S rRNA (adenine2503-C2)-methyltransferase
MCDAGSEYYGAVSADEMLEQIDYIVDKRFPNRIVTSEKFKVQFARVGEPAFNTGVLEVLRALPKRYNAPGLMACVTTIAPKGYDSFFNTLLNIKKKMYSQGKFQLQFSIHTTDVNKRDELIPVKKWSFDDIAQYGERFFEPGDRKITLNFAAIEGFPIDSSVLKKHFNPEKFLIKITPLNPTKNVKKNRFNSFINPACSESEKKIKKLLSKIKAAGFENILSIGDMEENDIGSNCGQIIQINRKKCEAQLCETKQNK